MNTLVMPLALFRRALMDLRRARRSVAWCRVGLCRTSGDAAWLARDFSLLAEGSTGAVASSGKVLHLALITERPPDWRTLVSQLPSSATGMLAIGDGNLRGHLWGVVRTSHGIESLHVFSLVGAGMHALQISNPIHPLTPSPSHPFSLSGHWSRTIGALGGEAIWQRLVRLSIAIIGCGRIGSLVAVTLARLGIRQLTLIDPDVVEEHNLGEMDAVTDADLSKPKVEAIVTHLHQLTTSPDQLIVIPSSVTADSALAACKRADVLFCCADNDAARLVTAILATLYHKVLVDIGTGIHFTMTDDQIRNPQFAIRNRTMGADVRLILPGDGCLLCRGNLTNYNQAVENLCNHRPPVDLQTDWNRQRAGSLRSLNQLAAGLGLHMLQELVTERIQQSVWARVEFDETGQLAVQYPPTQPSTDIPACALCAKAGLGDAGLSWEGGEYHDRSST